MESVETSTPISPPESDTRVDVLDFEERRIIPDYELDQTKATQLVPSHTEGDALVHESLIIYFIVGFLLSYYVLIFSLVGSLLISAGFALVVRLVVIHITGRKFSAFEIPVVDENEETLIPLDSIDYLLRTKKTDFTIMFGDDETIVRVIE